MSVGSSRARFFILRLLRGVSKTVSTQTCGPMGSVNISH